MNTDQAPPKPLHVITNTIGGLVFFAGLIGLVYLAGGLAGV